MAILVAAICLNDFAVSHNLSDAYFHANVAPSHRHFLRSKFADKFYQFKAMPFGLSSAPYLFTKLTRAISWYCPQYGIQIIFYLDDTVILARSQNLAINHRNAVMAFTVKNLPARGVTENAVMKATDWSSASTLYATYIRLIPAHALNGTFS